VVLFLYHFDIGDKSKMDTKDRVFGSCAVLSVLAVLLVLFSLVIFVVKTTNQQAPTVDPTPTQEVTRYLCNGTPSAEFNVLNNNPCLSGSVRTETGDWVEQYRPEKHYMVNNAVTVEGYPDEFSGNAPISYDGVSYNFDIWLKNGEWGFGLPLVVFEQGCHMIKATGNSVVNTAYPNNHSLKANLRLADSDVTIPLGTTQLPTDGDYENIWVFNVRNSIVLSPQVLVKLNWGTSLDDSIIGIESIFVMTAPAGYCNGEVLEVG
jgi:hypothetical protein